MFACSGIANELFTDFDRNFIKHRNLQHFGSNSLKNFNKLFIKKSVSDLILKKIMSKKIF